VGRLPWEAAVLFAAAILALAFHARLPTLLPADADHQAAAQVLQAEARLGDVLLLHPWWTERARLYAPQALPVVGYLGSDADSLEDYERIWVLSQPRLPFSGEAAFERTFLPGRSALGSARRFGPLSLTLYQNGRYAPALWRASRALSQTRVYVDAGQGQLDCAPDGRGGFVCPGGIRVATQWHELRFVPFQCISLSPPGGAASLVLELPAAPAGSTLVLEGGVVWEHAAKHTPGLTPLELELQAEDGVRVAGLQVPPGREGMQQVRARAPQGPLRLRVSSRQREERDACVELKALSPPEAG
jgi:hypothetical protein